jgi:uncharacterized protein YjiK
MIGLRRLPALFALFVVALFAQTALAATAGALTSVDLSTYKRVGRFDLPEPTRTTAPAGNLLAQEASGVAYDPDTDSLFVVGDGGTSVTQVSKTGALIDTMTLAAGGSPQGTEFYDTEGIAYVGNGEFVMTEERDRQLVHFTYAAGTKLSRGGCCAIAEPASSARPGRTPRPELHQISRPADGKFDAVRAAAYARLRVRG